MSHKFIFRSTFHSLLIAIDREIAEATRKKGCDCGGALHQSNYPRSPFGLSAEFRIAYEERFSFCCADLPQTHNAVFCSLLRSSLVSSAIITFNFSTDAEHQ